MFRSRYVLLFPALLVGLVACSFLPAAARQPKIPHLAAVDSSRAIYRGGQPSSLQDWLYLHDQLGVSNVIKLNTELEASDSEAELLGMRVYHSPIDLSQQLGLARMPSLVTPFPRVSGLFIHCEHGQDRTGLFVAMYRVAVNHWTKADAQKEMLQLGFHKSLRGLWEYWENYQ